MVTSLKGDFWILQTKDSIHILGIHCAKKGKLVNLAVILGVLTEHCLLCRTRFDAVSAKARWKHLIFIASIARLLPD